MKSHSDRFSEEVLTVLRSEIIRAGGNEVLFVAGVSSTGQCVTVRAAARGNRNSVPALGPHMESGDVVIHNHPSGQLQPSEPDLAVASGLGQQGIGFWIINNDATDCYAVCEPVLLLPQAPLSVTQASTHLSAGGSFSMALPNFESRPSQVELLKLLTRGFNENALVVAEAGTGVGKSFAYLIPSLLWAANNKERVVVSTATINLQQQLVEKDIPFVQRALGTSVKVVLVKGRRNYLCPSRLADELKELTMDSPLPADQLNAIAEWREQTMTGDVSELGFLPDETLWSRVCSDADTCHGMRCSQGDGCFLARARKEAAGAGVLVANHHLLFADLALRMNGFGTEVTAVLPPFQRIVFDEAHHIEKSATSYFSTSVTRSFLYKHLGRLYRKRRGRATGLVLTLQGLGTESIDFGAFPPLVDEALSRFDQWTTEALDILSGSSSLRISGPEGVRTMERAAPLLALVQAPLIRLAALCQDLAEVWEEEREIPAEAREVRGIGRKLEGLSKTIDRCRKFEDDATSVFWLERTRDLGGHAQVDLIISPLTIDQLMVKAVYDPFESVLFTSATLTVQGDFQYWKSRVGLNLVDSSRRLEGIFPSPFDYRHRVLLACPSDFPSPDQPEFQPAIEDFLPQLLLAASGSALVLFTSYESMKSAWQKSQPILSAAGISTYRQGEEERTKLLSRFKTDISSVLFATDSFWEGVDSPGDTLRLVVLCRLPFRVPSEPVLAARMELLERQGLDAFRNYSLPEAITRFKQGFGRLIRHTEDSGAVVVLDNRLIRKFYGAAFLSSVPETEKLVATRSELLLKIPAFLASLR